MKKRFIFLFLLLSTQIYGCSNHASEIEEIIPFGSELYLSELETLSVEEKETKSFETPAEEFHDDNHNTETTDASAQTAAMQPEEAITIENDSYYSAATDIPRAEVESYAAKVRQQFLEHDWSAISSEISYPITISGITYHNSVDFLDASDRFDGNLDETFFSAVEEEDCVEMFCSWEGIMLGETGQIWISEVLDEEFTSQGLKIVAINGMLNR